MARSRVGTGRTMSPEMLSNLPYNATVGLEGYLLHVDAYSGLLLAFIFFCKFAGMSGKVLASLQSSRQFLVLRFLCCDKSTTEIMATFSANSKKCRHFVDYRHPTNRPAYQKFKTIITIWYAVLTVEIYVPSRAKPPQICLSVYLELD